MRAQVDPDFTYVAAELSYLTAVEINGAIVCACVMTLKPLLAKFFPRVLSSRASASSSNPNRASDTLVGGPPTIGSRPSKPPQSPVDGIDGEMLGKQRAGTWVDGGYVEIDDSWGVDVELAENVRPKRWDEILEAQRRFQNGVVRVQTDITIIKEDK